MDGFSVSCIILGIIVIALHFIGATFLLKTNRNFTEHIELFSLSLSSVIIYILTIVRTIYGIHYPEYLKIDVDFKKLPKFASIHSSSQSSMVIPTFTSIISLTLQRYFAIRLHLRYEASWVFLNRTWIIVSSWFFGCMIFFATLIIEHVIGIDSKVWNIVIGIFLFLTLLATNVIFFAVYIYIYIKLRQSRQRIYGNQSKGKLFTPIIICSSFYVFSTLPYFFNSLIIDVRYIYLASYFDGITNSVVYIFLNEKVVNRIRRWNNNVFNDSAV